MNCINQNLEIVEGKVIIYQTKDGASSIDVRLEGETVWLTQSQLSELFQTDRTSILRHIKNIYKTDELDENSTCAFFTQVREEGHRTVTRRIPYYNLDMIISVGYRVNSKRGTQFRIWANKVLKEYLIKGFVINDKITQRKYEELSQLVHILGRTINSQPELSSQENLDLINVVTN